MHKLFAELIYCHCVALAPGLFSSVGVHIQHLLLVGLSAEWQRSNSDLSLTDFVYRTHILSVSLAKEQPALLSRLNIAGPKPG